MTSKKYLCIGGFVRSRQDRMKHYVSARRLPGLYRVPVEECVVHIDPEEPRFGLDGLIVLRPDPTGRYQVPENRPT